MIESILDVGCGASKITGAVGIDQLPLAGVDVVHDLNAFPWPFEDGKFDRIVFSHSISHLEDIPRVVAECHRLLKSGGVLEIVAPHYSSDNFNTDPTHRVHMGFRSMHYFVNNVDFGYRYLPDHCVFELVRSEISFREAPASWRSAGRKLNLFGLIGMEWVVNQFPRVYEKYFCWMIPASEVFFVLRKTNE